MQELSLELIPEERLPPASQPMSPETGKKGWEFRPAREGGKPL